MDLGHSFFAGTSTTGEPVNQVLCFSLPQFLVAASYSLISCFGLVAYYLIKIF